MNRSDLIRGRSNLQKGTAALETLLMLPFVFLLIVLLLNMGQAWLSRLKADRATRFAATYYVHLRSTGLESGPALSATRRTVQEGGYFAQVEDLELKTTQSSKELEPPQGGIIDRFGNILLGWLSNFSHRHRIELSAPVMPAAGNLMPASTMQADMEIDGNTFTNQEVNLSIEGLLDLLGEGGRLDGGFILNAIRGLLKAVFKSFFWLLGMVN